jgi:hypothetical protein
VTSELDAWGVDPKYHHIFKLFEVLLDPPPDIDLKAIDDLPEYLRNLCSQLVKIPHNGVRTLASHCWWLIHGISCIYMPTHTCSDVPTGLCNHSGKKVQWNHLLSHLEGSKRWLINWCPSVQFPSETKMIPKNRPVLRSMLQMFFNPEPPLRLHMGRIEGMYTYHEY